MVITIYSNIHSLKSDVQFEVVVEPFIKNTNFQLTYKCASISVCPALGKHSPSILSTLYLTFSNAFTSTTPSAAIKRILASLLCLNPLCISSRKSNLKRLLVIPTSSPHTVQVVKWCTFQKRASRKNVSKADSCFLLTKERYRGRVLSRKNF